MSNCNCGLNHKHKKTTLTANKKQSDSFGQSDIPEPAGIMILPDRVKELKLEEDGTVTVTMKDENGKEIEELILEFQNSEIAEKWIMDNFGDYL